MSLYESRVLLVLNFTMTRALQVASWLEHPQELPVPKVSDLFDPRLGSVYAELQKDGVGMCT